MGISQELTPRIACDDFSSRWWIEYSPLPYLRTFAKIGALRFIRPLCKSPRATNSPHLGTCTPAPTECIPRVNEFLDPVPWTSRYQHYPRIYRQQ